MKVLIASKDFIFIIGYNNSVKNKANKTEHPTLWAENEPVLLWITFDLEPGLDLLALLTLCACRCGLVWNHVASVAWDCYWQWVDWIWCFSCAFQYYFYSMWMTSTCTQSSLTCWIAALMIYTQRGWWSMTILVSQQLNHLTFLWPKHYVQGKQFIHQWKVFKGQNVSVLSID